MEFERQLYRVHDVFLYGLVDNSGRSLRYCKWGLATFAMLCAFLVVATVNLHVGHVRRGGCLESLLISEADAQCAAGLTSCCSLNGTDWRTCYPTDLVIRFSAPLGGIWGRNQETCTAGRSLNPEFSPLYLFSSVVEGVTLGQAARVAHGFPVLNVSICNFGCGDSGSAFDWMIDAGFVSYDTLAVNQAMYAFPAREGHLLSTLTAEQWGWTRVDSAETDIKGGRTDEIFVSIVLRVGALLTAVFAFAIASSTSALLLRITLSSGVAWLYANVGCILRCCTRCPTLARYRDLNAQFPTFGYPMRYYRAASESPTSFITAHILYVIFAYISYVSVSSLMGLVIYEWKTVPQGLHTYIYMTFLLAELFSLTLLRSERGMTFFPRLYAALYVTWHAYFYAFVYGFMLVALAAYTMAMITLMGVIIVTCEVPAMARGVISEDRTRDLVVSLPTPEHVFSLPGPWTMWMPLNARIVMGGGVYDEPVPPRVGEMAPSAAVVAPADPAVAGMEEGERRGQLSGGWESSSSSSSSAAAAQPPAAADRTSYRRDSDDDAMVGGAVTNMDELVQRATRRAAQVSAAPIHAPPQQVNEGETSELPLLGVIATASASGAGSAAASARPGV